MVPSKIISVETASKTLLPRMKLSLLDSAKAAEVLMCLALSA